MCQDDQRKSVSFMKIIHKSKMDNKLSPRVRSRACVICSCGLEICF